MTSDTLDGLVTRFVLTCRTLAAVGSCTHLLAANSSFVLPVSCLQLVRCTGKLVPAVAVLASIRYSSCRYDLAPECILLCVPNQRPTYLSTPCYVLGRGLNTIGYAIPPPREYHRLVNSGIRTTKSPLKSTPKWPTKHPVVTSRPILWATSEFQAASAKFLQNGVKRTRAPFP
ncbi:hypothetical protein FA13DRAFT_723262 [Coprinellus micaceus]|uniref:Uncharacterized protein n=1 Tax=Coprinellus micaceus TaxID=71717 RepID=A0A4Y7TVA7_COPMI|nr:hypothetical protein FA13DRAFT_723262 [Coprinellus micaceus]